MDILRIKFIVQKGFSFNVKHNQKLVLNTNKGILKFKISKTEADSFNTYCFQSLPFKFKITENTVAEIVDSLYLLSLDLDIGILINPDLKSSWIAKSFLDELKSKHGIDFYDDFIGAKVVKAKSKFIGSPPPTLSFTTTIETFENLLNKYYVLKCKKSEKLFRAIEIYNSSNYLTIVNRSGRFILQMSAIEALIDQPQVSSRLKNSLDSYILRVQKLKINQDERKSILGSLEQLKKTSIKRSGRHLVEKLLDNKKLYNGYPPSIFFSKAYDLRSKFVHDGITKTKELDIKTAQIQDFTKDILRAYLNKICC
jgi:hypothetical protein